VSLATSAAPRRRSVLSLALVALGLGAGLLAALAVLGPASEEPRSGAGGPLAWKSPPRSFPAPGLPRDRILTGVVRNASLEVTEVEARRLRVLDADGRRLQGSGSFLGSFVRGIYAASRTDQASDFERGRTGRLLRIGPGQERPLTVAGGRRRGAPPPSGSTTAPATCPSPRRRARPPGGPRAAAGPGTIERMPTAAHPEALRERTEALEAAFLSPLGARSYPARRAVPEEDSPVRTPFQRDRDRIVHSKAFRRLKHKTQVFISPAGDHYRTRLTHTLETCCIARTVARALGLNEDLTEAIGLGHDLGHPPFGHIGEAVLDRLLDDRYGARFRHHEHSLRVVDRLEDGGRGLNLTDPVRDGIRRHTGAEPPATLEGRIVRLVDRIAYINHDIDDAVRAGVLRADELPGDEIAVLGERGSERIDTLVRDLVEHSREAGDIVQGEEAGAAMGRLREFMFERVYLGAAVRSKRDRIERMLEALFRACAEKPPAPLAATASEPERVTDWIAGMTDRYAERAYAELTSGRLGPVPAPA